MGCFGKVGTFCNCKMPVVNKTAKYCPCIDQHDYIIWYYMRRTNICHLLTTNDEFPAKHLRKNGHSCRPASTEAWRGQRKHERRLEVVATFQERALPRNVPGVDGLMDWWINVCVFLVCVFDLTCCCFLPILVHPAKIRNPTDLARRKRNDWENAGGHGKHKSLNSRQPWTKNVCVILLVLTVAGVGLHSKHGTSLSDCPLLLEGKKSRSIQNKHHVGSRTLNSKHVSCPFPRIWSLVKFQTWWNISIAGYLWHYRWKPPVWPCCRITSNISNHTVDARNPAPVDK